jgi:hypothetical protein
MGLIVVLLGMDAMLICKDIPVIRLVMDTVHLLNSGCEVRDGLCVFDEYGYLTLYILTKPLL